MSAHFVDSFVMDMTPFKGPFKGKGANRKAIQILRGMQNELMKIMYDIVVEYNEVLPRGRGHGNVRRPHLCIFKPAGVPQLWWREAIRRSKYIILFGSDEGDEILRQFLPASIEVFKDFDRKRLHYNLKALTVGRTLAHYVKYMDGLSILDGYDTKSVLSAAEIAEKQIS